MSYLRNFSEKLASKFILPSNRRLQYPDCTVVYEGQEDGQKVEYLKCNKCGYCLVFQYLTNGELRDAIILSNISQHKNLCKKLSSKQITIG